MLVLVDLKPYAERMFEFHLCDDHDGASSMRTSDSCMLFLTAEELGKAIGSPGERKVRELELAGELFSVLLPACNSEREYPAFQAWPGIAGAPLRRVLAALATNALPSGPDAYGFFTSATDLLDGLTPIEVLVGRVTFIREVSSDALEFLCASAAERLAAVLRAAEAHAASGASW